MEFQVGKADGKAILRIEGELDAITSTELRPALERLLAERHTRIEVDLSDLRLIDSSGVGALVFLYKRAREYGGAVNVTGTRDQPLSIFRLLRLDRVLFG
jgi:anti-sigma B factor antagonist